MILKRFLDVGSLIWFGLLAYAVYFTATLPSPYQQNLLEMVPGLLSLIFTLGFAPTVWLGYRLVEYLYPANETVQRGAKWILGFYFVAGLVSLFAFLGALGG